MILKDYLVHFPQRPLALRDFLTCLGESDDIEKFDYKKITLSETGPVSISLKTDNYKIFENKLQKLWFEYREIR